MIKFTKEIIKIAPFDLGATHPLRSWFNLLHYIFVLPAAVLRMGENIFTWFSVEPKAKAWHFPIVLASYIYVLLICLTVPVIAGLFGFLNRVD